MQTFEGDRLSEMAGELLEITKSGAAAGE